MADETEPNLFADPRQAPPRALTRLSPLVRRLIAPNASPFTFNGTCTYIVGEGEVAVVDPGPGDQLPSFRDPRGGRGRADRDHSRHPYPSRPQPARRQTAGGDGRPRRRRCALPAQGRRDRRPRLFARPRLCARRGSGPRRAARGTRIYDRGSRHARPLRQSSLLFASGGARALFRRPCDGLVDVGRRSAGRLDARLHGLAREA